MFTFSKTALATSIRREEVPSRPVTHYGTQNDQLPWSWDLRDDEDFIFDEKSSGDKSEEDYDDDYGEDDEKDIHGCKEKDKVCVPLWIRLHSRFN